MTNKISLTQTYGTPLPHAFSSVMLALGVLDEPELRRKESAKLNTRANYNESYPGLSDAVPPPRGRRPRGKD